MRRYVDDSDDVSGTVDVEAEGDKTWLRAGWWAGWFGEPEFVFAWKDDGHPLKLISGQEFLPTARKVPLQRD
jgi:hypothetical protein